MPKLNMDGTPTGEYMEIKYSQTTFMILKL